MSEAESLIRLALSGKSGISAWAVSRKSQQSSDPTLIDAAKEEVGLSVIHDLDATVGGGVLLPGDVSVLKMLVS